MLHLIGVSHCAQARKGGAERTEGQATVSGFLKQIIQDVHPVFIAEEQSEENLAKHEMISIPKEISHSEGIEHRFCDPNSAERRSMGYLSREDILLWHKSLLGRNLPFEEYRLKASAIEMAHHFRKRERFWLRGLTGCCERNAVFVCGDSHIESFTSLLQNQNILHRVAGRSIGMTEPEREDARKIFQYLESHPELRNPDFARSRGGIVTNEQTDSGTAYNDLLERINQLRNEMTQLIDRIKRLEERAAREDSKAEMESMGKMLGQMARDGK